MGKYESMGAAAAGNTSAQGCLRLIGGPGLPPRFVGVEACCRTREQAAAPCRPSAAIMRGCGRRVLRPLSVMNRLVHLKRVEMQTEATGIADEARAIAGCDRVHRMCSPPRHPPAS